MIARPIQFYLAAMALALMAVSFPVQVMWMYGHHWTESQAIFSKITWINWLVIASLMVASYLYFHASRKILMWSPILLAVVAINNYIVGKFAGDFSLLQTSLATLGVGLVFAPLALPSSRLVLKDPKRRWWRRSRRFNKRVQTTVNPFVGDMVHGYTFDISKTGAFVTLAEETQELMPKVGDTVRLSLAVSSMKKVRCEAIVVRIADAQGKYPRGMGVRFTDIEKSQEKYFHRFIESPDFLN